jgi:sarcosine oxidase subunit beta
MVTAHMHQFAPRLLTGHTLPTGAPTVIVGAGIVGLFTAWFLAKRGETVLVLDGADGLATRTTSMSAHCIRAQFSEPDSIAMMSESLAFYEQFSGHLDLSAGESPIGLTQQGYLFASTDPDDADPFAARVRFQQTQGLADVAFLNGDEVRHRYPWLSPEIAVATYRERDGWIDSSRAARHLAGAAGCPIHLGVEVHQVDVWGGRVRAVATSHGTIATDRVVIAAGPFSGKVSPVPLPLSPVRRHRLIVRPRAAIPQTGPVTIDANTGAHWRPHEGGALMAWAQPEAAGEPVWPVPTDPEFIDLVLRGNRGIGRLAPFWHTLWPTLAGDDLLLTAGQYTITPDHRPLIGPVDGLDGLFLNTGYSGHGIMGAPSGARLLADLMTGTSTVSNPFLPGRPFDAAQHRQGERMVI